MAEAPKRVELKSFVGKIGSKKKPSARRVGAASSERYSMQRIKRRELMSNLMRVYPCQNCGRELDILGKPLVPGQNPRPSNECSTCGKLTPPNVWFEWSWAAKQLLTQECDEDELCNFRKSPIEFVRTFNHKPEREKEGVIVQIGGTNDHPALTTSKEPKGQ